MKEANSASAVRDVIIDRLIAGSYQEGSKLPSAGDLATELGVHRNTVTKAYRLLAESGIVTSKRGLGTFISTSAAPDHNRRLVESITNSLSKSVRQARRIGVSRQAISEITEEAIRSAYDAQLPRGFFVECNMPDIKAHIDEIASATDVHLEPLLLEEVSERFKDGDNSNMVVFTSLFHFREVDDILKGLGVGVDVIGVHTGPNEQTLQRIASIASGAKVGVVANNPNGSARINKLVTTYANVETTVLSSPTVEELLALAEDVDVLVSTRDQELLIRRLELPVPIVTLPFHVSQNSATRVIEVMLQKGGQEE